MAAIEKALLLVRMLFYKLMNRRLACKNKTTERAEGGYDDVGHYVSSFSYWYCNWRCFSIVSDPLSCTAFFGTDWSPWYVSRAEVDSMDKTLV